MSSLIGKHLQGGKYKLEALLGRGGFGLTFRAHQTYLDQVVVIKTLHESLWSAPNLSDLQRQFQDEARRLALCSHPNVVRVSDFFIEDNLPYMVMDYIPGRSLADIVLPDSPLAEAAAVDYIQQIGQALQAVHSKGLLHRDVKPQNIMIHELTGEAVLIDFGIARELSQNPMQTHTSIVSEGYAPIEQYLPKAQRSAATDIYGLAATLYTLLSAEVPVAAVLRDRNPLTPIQQLRSDVSTPVAQAIEHGMAVELKDRPQAVGPWITSLSGQKGTGFFSRTRQPSAPTPASFSEFPTQVVAPGYQSAARPSNRIDNRTNNRSAAATNQKTVAMPIPADYGEPATAGSRPQPQAQKRGCGCASTLMIATVAIAGIFVGGGFWLYQQMTDGPADLPEISAPEVEPLPPEPAPLEDSSLSEDENADEDAAAELEAQESEAEEIAEPEESEPDDPLPDTGDAQPPLILEDNGNPADAQPGDTGEIVPVPGFPPGASEDEIQGRLGRPTEEAATKGFYTATYNLVPNRITLGYVYEEGSIQVKQSEAAFSPSIDRLVMRTTLLGMLDGRSSKKIEDGLEDVRRGERDRFDFKRKGFSGAIERNSNGYIHMYVQN
ncbi:MAG: serine/threonine-protein kinase [Phormidesmis sp.]